MQTTHPYWKVVAPKPVNCRLARSLNDEVHCWMNHSIWAALLLCPVLAQTPNLPPPNRNGDYISRTSHRTWVGVDPDINGLTCRWSDKVPQEWYAPKARWPDLEIMHWPLVRRFPRGTVLTATPAGFATITDSRGLPWLKVSIGEEERICLVRANR
ncbi:MULTISPECIES: hypothetical protein [unclassified Thermosynechococcus]|uniref:hypothetical protein n=1 Tax=unclassified Thermosynechococcus TaxID=2622553 RepID=UPI0019E95BDD|nr:MULTISPECIES: hypothetical protein [unclassified Thermosynechococcus]HIK35629.1 hypothetical protein [Thermosynechococcus sp. M98_K2018_005]HIK48832.1 hypothetical protein [Thermosynechococcus sp. M55_K2018_012]